MAHRVKNVPPGVPSARYRGNVCSAAEQPATSSKSSQWWARSSPTFTVLPVRLPPGPWRRNSSPAGEVKLSDVFRSPTVPNSSSSTCELVSQQSLAGYPPLSSRLPSHFQAPSSISASRAIGANRFTLEGTAPTPPLEPFQNTGPQVAGSSAIINKFARLPRSTVGFDVPVVKFIEQGKKVVRRRAPASNEEQGTKIAVKMRREDLLRVLWAALILRIETFAAAEADPAIPPGTDLAHFQQVRGMLLSSQTFTPLLRQDSAELIQARELIQRWCRNLKKRLRRLRLFFGDVICLIGGLLISRRAWAVGHCWRYLIQRDSS